MLGSSPRSSRKWPSRTRALTAAGTSTSTRPRSLEACRSPRSPRLSASAMPRHCRRSSPRSPVRERNRVIATDADSSGSLAMHRRLNGGRRRGRWHSRAASAAPRAVVRRHGGSRGARRRPSTAPSPSTRDLLLATLRDVPRAAHPPSRTRCAVVVLRLDGPDAKAGRQPRTLAFGAGPRACPAPHQRSRSPRRSSEAAHADRLRVPRPAPPG